MGNIYVELAKKTIEELVLSAGKAGQKSILIDESIPEELKKKAGAFVSIKKKGELRGCIGTIQATKANLQEEIISNAISAASRDPRFSPIEKEELPDLEITVDVLEEPEIVNNIEELDPNKYGVIVEKGYQRGLLLPDLEGIDTVEEQLGIALKKAGLSPYTELRELNIYRFRVHRYK